MSPISKLLRCTSAKKFHVTNVYAPAIDADKASMTVLDALRARQTIAESGLA